MRNLKRITGVVIGVVLAACVGLMATGNAHVFSGLRKTYLIGKKTPDIDDMNHFDVREVATTNTQQTLLYSGFNQGKLSVADHAWSDSMGTTAFLVYWRDSLVYEEYAESDAATKSNSFSMAKSITSALIGRAIDEGFISSVDDRVGLYLSAYNEGLDTALTIRHLLEMTSGIPFGESYSSPFGYVAKSYYGSDLSEATLRFHVSEAPGTRWAYEGGNTVILGMVLKQATGMSASDFCSTRFWSPMGAEHDAFWNLDHENGIEKTFSGFYATARDFARFGLLYLNDGVWRGDTLVSPDWVRQTLTPHNVPDEAHVPCGWYGWHWWLGNYKGQSFFVSRGLRGQYVLGVPDSELMLVRLGHTQDKIRLDHMPVDLYRYIDMALNLVPTKKQKT